MEDHLGQMNLVEPEVAVHAAEVHRRDVPLEVCPELRAVHDVEQRSVHMGIEHGGHHNVAGLEREAVHIASGTEADVQGLGGVAVGKAVGHICGGEQQDILAAQGGLDIGFQLSALAGRQGVPVEVGIATG